MYSSLSFVVSIFVCIDLQKKSQQALYNTTLQFYFFFFFEGPLLRLINMLVKCVMICFTGNCLTVTYQLINVNCKMNLDHSTHKMKITFRQN